MIFVSSVLFYSTLSLEYWSYKMSVRRSQIMPNNMTENSFWTKANEEALADDDILKGLQNKFSSKPVGKKAEVTDNNHKNKKVSRGVFHEVLSTSRKLPPMIGHLNCHISLTAAPNTSL